MEEVARSLYWTSGYLGSKPNLGSDSAIFIYWFSTKWQVLFSYVTLSKQLYTSELCLASEKKSHERYLFVVDTAGSYPTAIFPNCVFFGRAYP